MAPRRKGTFGALALMLVACVVTACGPTAEEIRAQEQARLAAEAQARAAAEAQRQAEEARQQAERARLAELRAAEAAGDEVARQGDFDTALARYLAVLRQVQRYSEQDQRVRQSTIKVVRSMATLPPLSAAVMRYMVRGEAKVKAGGAGSYDAAAQEMEQALLEAPWLADGYFNLGTVQDKAGRFEQAIQNLRLYRFAAPQAQNAAAAQAKIYELEVKQEEAIRTLLLVGVWQNRDKPSEEWGVWMNAGKILVGGAYKLERKGLALEGFFEGTASTSHSCPIPGDKGPVTGTLSEDGASMDLHRDTSQYQVRYQGQLCLGVTLVGKESFRLRLVQTRRCKACLDSETLTPDKAAALGLQGVAGVLVREVLPGGPADKAGLRPGDVLLAYQGRDVPSDKALSDLADVTPIGSRIRLTYLRSGQRHDTVMVAGVAPAGGAHQAGGEWQPPPPPAAVAPSEDPTAKVGSAAKRKK
jgi:tetratricopeptide (TPR) repeat protein